MKGVRREYLIAAVMSAVVLICLAAFNALERPDDAGTADKNGEPDTSRFIVAIEDDPDTVDFQCTTINYTIAINVFDRLVETGVSHGRGVKIEPSLAKSWDISDDGRTYTFHLRDDVKFSNGSAFTSSDVLYTFNRLLTYPDSVNKDVAELIVGAEELESGESDSLEGIKLLGDYELSITLKEPFEAYLACLSMPGASILDEETTEKAGGLFGHDAEHTIGTGPYILSEWEPGKGMILPAWQECWSGPPKNEGLDLRFVSGPEEIDRMYGSGELDVLDIDDVRNSAEYYYRGDIYQDRQYKVQRICTMYIALNESVKPLDDVRVRKAMQLALNRPLLLDAIYSGRGSVVHGIYPQGLYGYNKNLEEIPYDPEAAAELMTESGHAGGFDLEIGVKASATQFEMDLIRLAASMWSEIGIRPQINVMTDKEFMDLRTTGRLPCYSAMWTADYNDPDNFVYTFFGNDRNTVFRSLNYSDEEVMKRVRDAKAIGDPRARIREYRDLEKKIIQEDAAWIPLFSRQYVYVTSERVTNLDASWNGSVKTRYRDITVREAE